LTAQKPAIPDRHRELPGEQNSNGGKEQIKRRAAATATRCAPAGWGDAPRNPCLWRTGYQSGNARRFIRQIASSLIRQWIDSFLTNWRIVSLTV